MIEWLIVGGALAVLLYATRDVTIFDTTTPAPTPTPDEDFVGPINQPDESVDMPNRSTSDVNVSQGVRDLADAIASAEGYGVAGAIPTRANNPGDLVMPGWRGGWLGTEKISVFDTPEAGYAALYHQLQLIESRKSRVYVPDMSIAEMADHWTRTQKPDWARNVAAHLASHGYPTVTVDTTLDEVFAA